jgi:hypothetical protein
MLQTWQQAPAAAAIFVVMIIPVTALALSPDIAN